MTRTIARWGAIEVVIVAVWLFILLTSGIDTTTAIVMFLMMNIVPLAKLCEVLEHRHGRRC